MHNATSDAASNVEQLARTLAAAMPVSPDVSRLIQLAIDAGQITLTLRDAGIGWRTKEDGSVVTRADEDAEALILAGLADLAPDVPVVAEERTARGDTDGTANAATTSFFLVDALDGTSEYVKGRDEFTVNIARIENGAPAMGVVVCPALARGFVGADGAAWSFKITDGAANGFARISVRTCTAPPTAVISRSHASPETLAFVDTLGNCDCVSFGSSLKLCRLADGTADVYPRLGRTMEWDIAAGHAVLASAGGCVLTRDGQPLSYGKAVQPDDAPYANPHFVAFGHWPDRDVAALARA
ncbi:MAG: 3'(2'),5'-bisphosphate nucleotidase CysQ [Pseudomonadota bacterium]